MPHTYLRNLRRENITLGFPKKNFSTTRRQSPVAGVYGASGNVFQPNLDLTRPYLSKKLAGNSLQGFKPLPKKLNKLGTIVNSIQKMENHAASDKDKSQGSPSQVASGRQ